MPDKLEEAVLSGALFADPSLSLDTLSEYRPPSPSDTSPINTDDELGSDLSDYEPPSDSITSRPYTKSATPAAGASSQQSTRTGPKGVLQDSQNAKAEARTEQMLRAKEGREGMERRALLGSTWKEEEAMRDIEDRLKRGEIVDEDDEAKRRWKEKRVRELNGGGSKGEGGKRRGHLREVGMEGYLRAVEDDGWTVVLIYEPVRCPSFPPLESNCREYLELISRFPPSPLPVSSLPPEPYICPPIPRRLPPSSLT
jgi:hypothetical protein